MPTVHFTSHLQAFVDCPAVDVAAGDLRQVLDTALEGNPRLASYVLDDQRRLRRHIMVFLDGRVVTDRIALSDPVAEDSEVHVMQALSGG